MNRDMYSPREVSEKLGVSPSLVYKQVNSGRMPAMYVGSRICIPKQPIDNMINNLNQAPGKQTVQNELILRQTITNEFN